MHRGSHANIEEGRSDCGAADNLTKILETAIGEKSEISKRLREVYDQNSEVLGMTPETFDAMVSNAYEFLDRYTLSHAQLTGERLVEAAEHSPTAPASVETVQGNHGERVAYVNFKANTTFDTNKTNQEGQQAFNLDVWMAVEQAKALGLDENFALGTSLILYQSTEMVLVEQKGDNIPPLPVKVHV